MLKKSLLKKLKKLGWWFYFNLYFVIYYFSLIYYWHFKKRSWFDSFRLFFMKNYAPFCSEISFHQRRFVILDYSIKETEFTVKIDYYKEEFDHPIHQYVMIWLSALDKIRYWIDLVGWTILFFSTKLILLIILETVFF